MSVKGKQKKGVIVWVEEEYGFLYWKVYTGLKTEEFLNWISKHDAHDLLGKFRKVRISEEQFLQTVRSWYAHVHMRSDSFVSNSEGDKYFFCDYCTTEEEFAIPTSPFEA